MSKDAKRLMIYTEGMGVKRRIRSKQQAKNTQHVALMVQTTHQWHREVLRGVASYAHQHTQWEFYFEPRGLSEKMQLPRNWTCDGIIARVTHPALARAIRRLGVPAVNVSWLDQHSHAIPRVISDEAGCARLAAEYFLEKGFVSYGYVGPAGRPQYGQFVGRAFAQVVGALGHPCSLFLDSSGDASLPLHDQRAALSRWLKKLPRPAALLVWNSEIGREVTTACAALPLTIPDEIAVLCIEDDALMSSLAPAPLSTIDQCPHRVGYEAAATLDRMMQGESTPAKPQLIPPAGIVARRSTDTLAVDDETVARAIKYIRQHIQQPIQVIDVCKEMQLSRRALEHRFVQVLGRTPAAEIRRARLERVSRLLIDTDLPMAAIAQRTGFNHPEVMVRAFHRVMGLPPGQFRRQHHGRLS